MMRVSFLQNSPCRADFFVLKGKAEEAGCHFWHDGVIEPNIITPAEWILSNPEV